MVGSFIINPSVRGVAQEGERVGSVLRVQVAAGRDGVYSGVWGLTITGGERVVLVVVIPEEGITN